MVAIGNIGALVPLTPSALAVRALEQAVNAQLGVQAQPPAAQDVVQISLQARTQSQTVQPDLAVGLNFANAIGQPATGNALTLNLAIPALPLDVGAPLVTADTQAAPAATAPTAVVSPEPTPAPAVPPEPAQVAAVDPNQANLTAVEIANRQAATLGVIAGELRANYAPLETLYARGDGSDLLVSAEVAGVPELTGINAVERQPPNALMSPAVQDALALSGVQRAAPGFEVPEAFPAVTSRLAAEAYRIAAA